MPPVHGASRSQTDSNLDHIRGGIWIFPDAAAGYLLKKNRGTGNPDNRARQTPNGRFAGYTSMWKGAVDEYFGDLAQSENCPDGQRLNRFGRIWTDLSGIG
jgi:hypothetical protein